MKLKLNNYVLRVCNESSMCRSLHFAMCFVITYYCQCYIYTMVFRIIVDK